jgi:DNA helicase IV
LIVGTINRIILSIYKKSKTRFEAMRKNKFVDAYCDNVKPVIGVDEATDYTVIDYYFISSFLHYEYSSLTLCGDIMQGLNAHGIKSWNELKAHLFPNMEVVELKRSYRQLPTLVEMSKQIYKDTLGVWPAYNTTIERQEIEPTPIYFVSDDMEEKAEWMAKRIIEVMNFYDGAIPSIAILVGDDVNIRELVDEINDQDYLNGIQIYDCSEGRTATSKNAVKVYRLSEVKGMEFEVAFFYDIDEALAGQSIDMMRRYLYVGISRASSHLAATFTKREGNEDIIKYFDSSKDNWKL